ncbi:30S ribosome-binding factor RbfA [bacterium]|nr:30S ribosome-binding factor RbfA [bacterium]
MKSFRPDRVGGLIKRELSEIFRIYGGEFGSGLLTVTEVRVPSDLRSATVWVSIYCDKEQIQEIFGRLCKMSAYFRHLLASRAHLRRVPELHFKLDKTLETAMRIENLLDESGIREITESEQNEDEL